MDGYEDIEKFYEESEKKHLANKAFYQKHKVQMNAWIKKDKERKVEGNHERHGMTDTEYIRYFDAGRVDNFLWDAF